MAPRSSGASAPKPEMLAEMLHAAMARHQAGALIEAEHRYRQILALAPGNAELHGRLGAVLMSLGKAGEALLHLERAAALKPDLFETFGNLAQAYLAVGRFDPAIKAACRALELKETPQSKAFFVLCMQSSMFTTDDGRHRKFLVRALNEGWARPRELTNVCIRLIKLNSRIKDYVARAGAARPNPPSASELATLANDEVLINLLQRDPVTDIGLEYLLTSARETLLGAAAIDEEPGAQQLKFYAALARQCFINEYVYSLPPREAEQARVLQQQLAKAIADNARVPFLLVVAVGAYVPLHTLPGAESLIERTWPEPIAALLVQQVKEPARERELAAQTPRLTVIDDEISRAVRQQYEENPYPRWTASGPPMRANGLDQQNSEKADVLIAGCGTGLSTIELAREKPNARIVAIDLSLASLSYARRMAESLGLTNIEFAQADIKEVVSIDRQFDFIDSSGVLHHMGDPWAGWKALLSRLRRGGTMQIGLYSELARQNVVAARALIATRGYPPTTEGIRSCREYITASDDPLLKSLLNSGDFYTINECRDLLFHVQEHRLTLPQIKLFLIANNAQFAGFVPNPAIERRFTARFPERSALLDLDCWHAFETEVPNTFAGMYQFWVHKPPA